MAERRVVIALEGVTDAPFRVLLPYVRSMIGGNHSWASGGKQWELRVLQFGVKTKRKTWPVKDTYSR